jgi:hypothetical protein
MTTARNNRPKTRRLTCFGHLGMLFLFSYIILLLTTLLGTSQLTTTTDADSETTTASQAQTKGPKHERRVVMTKGGRCWRTLGGDHEWCPRHVVWRVLGLFSMLFFIFHLFFHYWLWLLGSDDERRAVMTNQQWTMPKTRRLTCLGFI